MTPEFIIDLAMRTLRTTMLLAAPPLLAGLVIGVVVSMLQAVTQIQEQNLVQVPKMFGVVLVLLTVLPWMLEVLLHFTTQLFVQIPNYIR